MGNFLRENWIWIVAPIVIVLVLFVAFMFLMSGDDANSPFIYNIF
ncbi:MAG TPA: DUF5989 family protein [Planctomycetota bacterium]|nr:DUF5989 family protein [Planctomycetota bacterium]